MGVRDITRQSALPQPAGSDIEDKNRAHTSSATASMTSEAQHVQLNPPAPAPGGILSGLPKKMAKEEESKEFSEEKSRLEEAERTFQKEKDVCDREESMARILVQFSTECARRIEDAARSK
ncbi:MULTISPECIES: hypothetical protein [Burkholderia]|uniref:hypothetical protein n=1 Tax=Burkholderia TaxID=32008 RepID=UPI000AD6E38F|nr:MULTISPECIES: hypothetical protein [Burkholderia]